MPVDHYRTLRSPAEFRHKIERSEFLGIGFPCQTDDAFFVALHQIEKRHFNATHHCWAFRLFEGGHFRQRSSDAGEPSGTAGKPILNAIESADLSDAGVVVVRWYGGVKLGTGGLARAYRDTAVETLRHADIAERFIYDRFLVRVPFDMLGMAYRLVDPPNVQIASELFGEFNEFAFDVRRSRSPDFARLLAEKRFTFTPPSR